MSPFRMPAALLVTLVVLGGGQVATADAQPSQANDPARAAPTPSGAEVSSGGQAAAKPDAPSLTYESAFDGYRPYSDETVEPWARTNDTVGRIGGWKAYAREALAAESAPPGSGGPPADNPAPADNAARADNPARPDNPAPLAGPPSATPPARMPVPSRGIQGRP